VITIAGFRKAAKKESFFQIFDFRPKIHMGIFALFRNFPDFGKIG